MKPKGMEGCWVYEKHFDIHRIQFMYDPPRFYFSCKPFTFHEKYIHKDQMGKEIEEELL